MEDEIETTLAWLGAAPHGELKAAWRRYCPDWALPKKTSVQFLRIAIAWKAQEQVHGGHSPEVLALLGSKPVKPGNKDQILPGTILRRTWRGDLYEVMVLKQGFAHEGETYGSLSEIARVITGTRWNGPAFFGLRRQKKQRAEHACPEAAS
jgi:hypothetical protein